MAVRRVYRLHDFTKSHIITPDQYDCVSGKVNSADKLYLVLHGQGNRAVPGDVPDSLRFAVSIPVSSPSYSCCCEMATTSQRLLGG
jgi:hypothetical protein